MKTFLIQIAENKTKNKGGYLRSKNIIVQLTQVCSLFILKYVSEGDIVIDATMGNGIDTLFLAKLVGNKGKVFAFDIQEEAIQGTKRLLEKELSDNRHVFLIKDSHINMKSYVNNSVSAVVFNLGYLPKGNHTITTMSESTLTALKISLDLLKKDGLLSVLIYPGHKEGTNEKDMILNFASQLDTTRYHTLYLDMINQGNFPPSLLLITKKQ